MFAPQAGRAVMEEVDDLILAALAGQNAAVLAMGRPASGKTTLMQGMPSCCGQQNVGLVQQAVQQLFEHMHQKAAAETAPTVLAAAQTSMAAPPAYAVHMTAFEIIEERLCDLLTPASGTGATPWGRGPRSPTGGCCGYAWVPVTLAYAMHTSCLKALP